MRGSLFHSHYSIHIIFVVAEVQRVDPESYQSVPSGGSQPCSENPSEHQRQDGMQSPIDPDHAEILKPGTNHVQFRRDNILYGHMVSNLAIGCDPARAETTPWNRPGQIRIVFPVARRCALAFINALLEALPGCHAGKCAVGFEQFFD